MLWRQQPRNAQARGARVTRQHAEDQQLYNRTSLTSWAHRGSLSKRRELVLSSLFLGEKNFLSLFSDSFASSELSFASFSACLSVLFAPSDEGFCAVQLTLQLFCRTLGSKRIELCSKRSELLRSSACFLAFRLSFPPSRRAALTMHGLIMRSTSRPFAELPAPDTQQRRSSVEHIAFSVTVVLSTFAPEWFTQALSSLQSQLAETHQQHQKPSPPPRCYRQTFTSSNVGARRAQHPRRSSPNSHE